jgi:hypothetical protein
MTVGRETPTRSAISVLVTPSAARSKDASPLREHGRRPAGSSPSAQLGQVLSGDWKRGSSRHAAYSHTSPHRQATSATEH